MPIHEDQLADSGRISEIMRDLLPTLRSLSMSELEAAVRAHPEAQLLIEKHGGIKFELTAGTVNVTLGIDGRS